jgi:hypothetical protein
MLVTIIMILWITCGCVVDKWSDNLSVTWLWFVAQTSLCSILIRPATFRQLHQYQSPLVAAACCVLPAATTGIDAEVPSWTHDNASCYEL